MKKEYNKFIEENKKIGECDINHHIDQIPYNMPHFNQCGCHKCMKKYFYQIHQNQCYPKPHKCMKKCVNPIVHKHCNVINKYHIEEIPHINHKHTHIVHNHIKKHTFINKHTCSEEHKYIDKC